MTFSNSITSIIETQCVLGEGAYYSPASRRAYWVDIRGFAIYQMDWTTQRIHKQPFNEPVCWIVERRGGDLLVGFERSIHYVNPNTWERTLLTSLNNDSPFNRLNDACVDGRGTLYFGTMDNNERSATGSLYRLNRDLTHSQVDSSYIVSNGPAVSPCGAWLYSVASCERTIYRMQIEPDASLSNKQPWIIFDETMGIPDGLTVDSDGCLWVAAWDGSGVFQFSAQGVQQRFVPLPALRITSVVFAGDNLEFLLVTSASVGLTPEQQTAFPHSGNTFLLNVDTQGLPPSQAGY